MMDFYFNETNILSHYLYNHSVIRKLHVHVTLGGVLAIKESLGSHPLDWQTTLEGMNTTCGEHNYGKVVVLYINYYEQVFFVNSQP